MDNLVGVMPCARPELLHATDQNLGLIVSGVLAIARMASFMPNLYSQKFLGSVCIVLSFALGSSPGLAKVSKSSIEQPTFKEEPESDTPYIRPQASCPQDFAALSTLLIRDIPSYTNRILQSSVADIRSAYRPAYVITASQPDRVPLEIKDRVYTTLPDDGQDLQQLFFTTLERQYSESEAISISHFHWLFLAPDEAGWQMVFMFSAIEAEDENLLPPRDSSQGSVGQAVQRWLQDCQARAIQPM
ncbi:hypothetical protein D0962_14790 [Leptolyngbyaceae cyanobacterium CCMR0082]|uniref:Uncharacterized protein n=1 Tax=Adonisia turfae CCMR0082 TaxID=2304604 RepID=A0A6M0S6Q1_9CYAN|nr:hypothetical protein [Adonisia turfae]NEZ64040.1 hypothetical protein [Adonisia turfae CCMR0082]